MILSIEAALPFLATFVLSVSLWENAVTRNHFGQIERRSNLRDCWSEEPSVRNNFLLSNFDSMNFKDGKVFLVESCSHLKKVLLFSTP